jgi:uncharacterized protein YxjI
MFTKNTYLIRERVAFLKFADVYDLVDPETGQPAGVVQEKPDWWIHVLRFVVNKRILPTTLHFCREEGGAPVFVMHRRFLNLGISLSDANGRLLGSYKSKFFSLGGAFHVMDAQGQKVAELNGDWKGWNFKFTGVDGRELGVVTKQWAGVAKELFTSADNYVVNLSAGQDARLMPLLMGVAIAVDIVHKEK